MPGSACCEVRTRLTSEGLDNQIGKSNLEEAIESNVSRAQSLNPYDDDDAESGNGPSLPMSPHSVDGAIGGRRVRSVGPYDSSDDEQKNSSGRSAFFSTFASLLQMKSKN